MLRKVVPSLAALATFEAAARLQSFTLAAAELGVTQAAVSRQVKQLEADLNTQLFVRAHRRVVLTQPGAALSRAVSGAFGTIAEVIETIRQPVVPNVVAVGATLAFGHLWILPRLSDFRATHPEINLKLVADDTETDLRRDRLDVAVRFGTGPFPDARIIASHPDEVFPVCSPALLNRLGLAAETADLARLPLIESETTNPTWLTWRSWAQGVGLGPTVGRAADRSRLRFNHYTDTVQAALNGEGVALGWATLLSGHLREGRLARLGTHCLALKESYHVLVPPHRLPTFAARVFLGWIEHRFAAR